MRLFATRDSPDRVAQPLLRSTDGGVTFAPVEVDGVPTAARTVADRDGRLFLVADAGGEWEIITSGDLGESWERLDAARSGRQIMWNTDPIEIDAQPAYLFTSHPSSLGVRWAVTTDGQDWSPVSRSPAGGAIEWMAWDGNVFRASADRPNQLYSSVDAGLNWTMEARPKAGPNDNDWGDWVWGADERARRSANAHAQIVA